MKILITEISGSRIVSENIGTLSPIVGGEYVLEDAREGTSAQNKFFHLLVGILYRSEAHNYPVTTKEDLRKYILRDCGLGFDRYYYTPRRPKVSFGQWAATAPDGRYDPELIWETAWAMAEEIELCFVDQYEDLPEEFKRGGSRVRARLKPWSTYTLKQRRETIGNLITYMIKCEVKNEQFDKILDEYHQP